MARTTWSCWRRSDVPAQETTSAERVCANPRTIGVASSQVFPAINRGATIFCPPGWPAAFRGRVAGGCAQSARQKDKRRAFAVQQDSLARFGPRLLRRCAPRNDIQQFEMVSTALSPCVSLALAPALSAVAALVVAVAGPCRGPTRRTYWGRSGPHSSGRRLASARRRRRR